MSQRILVVDDDPAITLMIRSRLEAHQYDVIIAFDGEQGLKAAQEVKPHLIILDIMMPNVDGYTFVQELKKIDSLRLTPIIIITAKEQMEDLFRQEGIKDFLIKPFDVKTLIDKIRGHLGPLEVDQPDS